MDTVAVGRRWQPSAGAPTAPDAGGGAGAPALPRKLALTAFPVHLLSHHGLCRQPTYTGTAWGAPDPEPHQGDRGAAPRFGRGRTRCGLRRWCPDRHRLPAWW